MPFIRANNSHLKKIFFQLLIGHEYLHKYKEYKYHITKKATLSVVELSTVNKCITNPDGCVEWT